MNWASTVQRIKEELHRFGSADEDTIKRAICRAIFHYEDTHLKFNNATYDITLTAGTLAYGEESAAGAADGYPSDFKKVLNLSIVHSGYTYPTMIGLNIRDFRKVQELSTSRGYPCEYTIFDDEILLNPAPSDAFTLRLDYIQDLGVPVAKYEDGAWTYTYNGTAITDATTNAWFTEGEDLIAERSKAIILGSNFKDFEAAQASRFLENEFLQSLLVKSEMGQYPSTPEPWV